MTTDYVSSFDSTMATDEEKNKISKLLQGLEVPEVKLTERCFDLVKLFHEKFSKEVEEEEMREREKEPCRADGNPYKVDPGLLEENERRLGALLAEGRRVKKVFSESVVLTGADPKRPWRTNSSKEKLLRIDNELERHLEKGAQDVAPLAEGAMSELVRECREESRASASVAPERLRETVMAAKKNLPNFQYQQYRENLQKYYVKPKIIVCDGSTMAGSGQYLPRPDTRWDFMRALLALRNLRVLALEYAHLADSTGGALLSLTAVLRRPRMRLQLMCREDQIPGHTDESRGVGGHVIPDPAWRRVAIDCPDLYLLMAFCRVRDYDELRRFLTPSIPLREVHVQYGIDLHPTQRQDSDVSCVMRHLAFRYSNNLACLSIHQWRFATFPLWRVLELMPRLVRLQYAGGVRDAGELERTLQAVACGIYEKLKHLKIQIQDKVVKRVYWSTAVDKLTEKYDDIMDLFDIHLCISVYKN